jgi:hypothetical protein
MAETNHSINIYLNEEAVATSLGKLQAKAQSLQQQMEQAASPEEFARLEKQLGDTNSKMAVLDKQLKGELNPSIKQMEGFISKARNELKNMAAGTDEFNAKAKQLRDAEARLKDIQAQAKGVSTALDDTGKAGGGAFGMLKSKVTEFAGGLPGIGQAIGMMMGPFGLLLGIATGLIAIIRQNAEVADKFSFVMGALKNIIRAIADDLVGLIKNGLQQLQQYMDNPKQAIIDFGNAIRENIENRFKAVGLILTAIREKDFGKLTEAFVQLGTGVEDLGGKTAAYGKKLLQAGKDGYEAAEKLDALGLKQQQLQTAIARTQISIEQQTTAMKDATRSDQERLNAANAIIAMEAQNAQRRIDALNLEKEALDQQTAGRVRNGEEEAAIERLTTQIIQEEANKQAAIRKAVNERAQLQAELKAKADKEALMRSSVDTIQTMQGTALEVDKITVDLTKRTSTQLLDTYAGFKSYAEYAFKEFQQQLGNFMNEWSSSVQAGVGLLQNVFSLVSQTMQTTSDKELANERRNNEDKKKKYKEMLDSKKITQSQYNSWVELADKDLADKERERKRKAFIADKAMRITMAVINTALSVLNAFATMPYPAAIVMAALAGATGAVQIGLIASQPVPQFAKGGVARGASHAQGGISMVNADGQKVGEMEGGEPYLILSRDTYRNNGRLIDALLYNSMHKGGAPVAMADMPRFNFGGVWQAMRATRYAMGGIFVPQQVNDNASLQLLASIDDKLSNPVRAEVVYEDINDRAAAINRASSRASFSRT